ncbi:hypothetical protein B0T16DRAFT_451913 [Cercophora newfieldiana]|uniref:Uncharacterized protein n=1 Tax=Cercophora newfieldiana TaxID=92897 RepID=A0AA39YPH9_9PEZI|nr:hypothetical protein B0T16DRAFT_451913 [Cercophora newfieldiana]
MFRDSPRGTRSAYPPDGDEFTAAKTSALSTVPEKGKQPTYTTVGSIYNPHAATPLQPPTRRPRTRRYPPTIQSPPGEPFLGFPNALLSVLPMKDRVQTSPPPTVKPAPHYSPLQQNYDRAVSPAPEEDSTFLADIGMSIPSIRSGNLPPVGLGISPGMGVKKASTVFGDGDNVFAEDTLVSSRITVKGLTNLASYPNPMQKAAQNQLAKARVANPALQRTETPLQAYGASGPHKERVVSGATAPIGTPKPLTAGPPGQRQFRPSTFESTVRALGGLDQDDSSTVLVSDVDDEYQQDFDPTAPYATSLAQFFTSENTTSVKSQTRNEVYPYPVEDQAALSQNAVNEALSDDDFYNDSQREIAERPLTPASLKQARRRVPYDTEPLRSIKQYYPGNRPRDLGRRPKELAGDEFDIYKPRPFETASAQKARRKQNFYAGTGGLAKTLGQLRREHDDTTLKSAVGVIGEGRGRTFAQHSDRLGRGGKVQLPHLSVEQANNTHDLLHSEPLITMGFATFLRHKEEMEGHGRLKGPTSGFIPCDPAWVDDSTEGNKSFFDTSKDSSADASREELLRKKKMFKRRAGRGY